MLNTFTIENVFSLILIYAIHGKPVLGLTCLNISKYLDHALTFAVCICTQIWQYCYLLMETRINKWHELLLYFEFQSERYYPKAITNKKIDLKKTYLNLPLFHHSIDWLWSSHEVTTRTHLRHWMMAEWRSRHSKLRSAKASGWCKMRRTECRSRASRPSEWRTTRRWAKWSTTRSIILCWSSWIGRRRKTGTAHILWRRWSWRRWTWRRRWRCILWCIWARWRPLKLYRLSATCRTPLTGIWKYWHRSAEGIWPALCKSSGAISLVFGNWPSRTTFPTGTWILQCGR